MNERAVIRERTAAQILIVGYGNELRGDDAAGVRVARAVATWELPNVSVLAVPQLTPELAATLAGVEYAIFVDAGPGSAGADFGVTALTPCTVGRIEGHTADPGSLLGLAEALYRRSPNAWLLTIPYANVDMGSDLSTPTARGVLAVLRYLRDRLPHLSRAA